MKNKYEVVLDIITDIKSDPSKIKRIQQDIINAFKNISLELGIDATQSQKVINEFNKLLNLSESELNKISKLFSGLELDLNTDDAIKDIDKLVTEIDKIANTGLGDLLSEMELPDEVFDEFAKSLKKIGEDENIKQLAADFDKLEASTRQQLETQKKALKQLELTGQIGTESYRKLKEQIKASETELGKLTETAKQTKSFMDRMATFGLAAQGIQQVAESMSLFTGDFVALDTAIQRIKTLGGEARELAPAFRESAIQLSKELPISSSEIAHATYEALSAGIKATEKDINAFMEASGKLAVGGGESIGSSVNVLSSLINAYGLEATQASKISDELFTTINIGKTTLPELSYSLSQVIPNAAQMGLEFKNVGASLAIMTANGIPTAQATTKLNAMLTELQKPSESVKKALVNAGLSVKEFGHMIKEGRYAEAMGMLSKSFGDMGVTATQAFSSIEAAAAFSVLTKDMDKLNETVASFATSAGATEMAFLDMSEGIENKLAGLKSILGNIFISINDTLGSSFALLVGTAQQIAPIMISLQGLGSILPVDKIKEMAGALVAKLVPSLIVTEGAQKRLNFAILANPYVMAVAGIAALVGALYMLHEAMTVTAAERQEQIEKESEALDKQIQITEKQKEMANSKIALIDAFEREGEAAMRNNDLLLKLSAAYPGVIKETDSYAVRLEKLKTASEKSSEELDKLKKDIVELQTKKIDLEIRLSQAKFDVKIEDIQKEIAKEFETGWAYSWFWDGILGVNEDIAKTITEKYINAIKTATTQEELQTAVANAQMAIFNDPKFHHLDDATKASLVERYEEIGKIQEEVMKKTSERMTNVASVMLKEIAKGNLTNEKAIENISKAFGLSKEKAVELLEEQKKQTQEASNTADAVSSIAGRFDEVKKAASDTFSKQKGDIMQIQYQLIELNKLKKTETDQNKLKQYDKEIKALNEQKELLINQTKQTKNQLDAYNNIETATNQLFEKRKETGKSVIELADDEYHKKSQQLELQKREFELSIKQKALAEGRSLNENDNMLIQLNNLEIAKKQQHILTDIYKKRKLITIDENNKIIIGAKLKEDTKIKVQENLHKVVSDVNTQEYTLKNIIAEIKFDINKLKSEVDNINQENLKLNIQLNVTTKDELEEYINTQILKQESLKEIKTYYENKLLEDEKAFNVKLQELSETEKLKSEFVYQKQKLENLKLIEEINKDIIDTEKQTTEIIELSYNTRTKAITEWYESQKTHIEKYTNLNKKTIEEFYKTFAEAGNTNTQTQIEKELALLESEKTKKLNVLENYNKLAIYTTLEYENEKTKIEQEAIEKRTKLQEDANKKKHEQEQMLKGAILELQRVEDAKLIALEVAKLEKEVALNQEKFEAYQKGNINLSADEINKIVETSQLLDKQKEMLRLKGTELGIITSLAAEQIQAGMTNWFAGDPKAMEKSAQEFFNTIKGILEKKIIAYILDLVLSPGTLKYLSALPFPLNVLSVPLATATITAGVKAITTPLLNQLSFATGGQINKPTMAILGDGAKLGGDNKEWIFRNDQLKLLTSAIVRASNNNLENKLNALYTLMENQKIETKLRGEDILISINRTQNRKNDRIY